MMYPWQLPLSQIQPILQLCPRLVSWKFQDSVVQWYLPFTLVGFPDLIRLWHGSSLRLL